MLLDQNLSVHSDLKYSSVRVGIQDTESFSSWLSKGYHSSMMYLSKNDRVQKNADTSLLERNSKSIIVFLLNYKRKKISRAGYGRIASYAGFTDYHKFLPRLIEKFMVENRLFLENYRTYVDTGPLLERYIARKSSLGWIGKNSMLIDPSIGSFTFIGAAVTDLPIDSSYLPSQDLCGRCTRCIDSCPTGAINIDRTIDSNLCISYHTIENRGIIPRSISDKMDDMIFGCDICNDVCPWNSGKKESSVSDVLLDSFSNRLKLEDLAFMDKETFDTTFKGSAIKRATFEGLARNAVIALHNGGNEDLVKEVSRRYTGLRGDQASLFIENPPNSK